MNLSDNSLGEGNAFVRVSVELDFDARSVDRQTFTPVVDESGIIRSQQDISESYNGESNTPGGPAGVQGNIPGYVAEDRNSKILFNPEKYSTEKQRLENEKHRAIKRMTIYPDRIELDVKTKEQDVFTAVSNLAIKLQRTLDYCRSVVDHRTPYEITQKKVIMNVIEEEG